MCMCVYVYVCMYASLNEAISRRKAMVRVCACVYIHVWMYVLKNKHTYIRTYIHMTWTGASEVGYRKQAYIHTYIYTCMHTYTWHEQEQVKWDIENTRQEDERNIHTYMHIYMHTYTRHEQEQVKWDIENKRKEDARNMMLQTALRQKQVCKVYVYICMYARMCMYVKVCIKACIYLYWETWCCRLPCGRNRCVRYMCM